MLQQEMIKKEGSLCKRIHSEHRQLTKEPVKITHERQKCIQAMLKVISKFHSPKCPPREDMARGSKYA